MKGPEKTNNWQGKDDNRDYYHGYKKAVDSSGKYAFHDLTETSSFQISALRLLN